MKDAADQRTADEASGSDRKIDPSKIKASTAQKARAKETEERNRANVDTPGEELSGEGSPGLTLTGGGGHA
jgi:hypothetical protein